MTMNHRALWSPWFSLVLVLAVLEFAQADGASSKVYIREASRYRDDMLFLAVTSLSFAFLISFIASIFAYVSFLDSRITKRYQSEASTVEADVISTEPARSGSVSGGFCIDTNQKEYNVVVEYDQIIPPNGYRMKVRKQVGVVEEDFVHPNHSRLQCSERVFSLDSVLKQTTDGDVEAGKVTRSKPPIILNQDSFFQKFVVEERKIELLVINGHPKSGFPLRQHARKMDSKNHLATFFYFGVALLVTAVCTHISARMLYELVDMRELRQRVAFSLVFGFIAAIALQIPLTHLALNKTFQQMLEEEYFGGGDMMQTGQDDSTLSSGSDTYLLHRYKSMDSVP